jgi:aminopeptidase N
VLAAHETDAFCRYEAVQMVFLAAIDAHCAANAAGGAAAESGFAAAIAVARDVLAGADADPALAAETLLLPSESMIGDRHATIDPDAIFAAREALRAALLAALREPLWAAWRGNGGAAGSDLSPRAKGQRRLRNVVLGLLMADQSADATAAAFGQFDASTDMTARMGALGALASSTAAARETALARFAARFAGDANVMDKWFAVQAASARADTLATVRTLAARADYSPANPNRLRALVLSFAANPVRFHAADGSGYDFLQEQLLAVDAINPGSAARLATALGRWRRFGPPRQALMRARLQAIGDTPGISRDVAEMVSNSLEG